MIPSGRNLITPTAIAIQIKKTSRSARSHRPSMAMASSPRGELLLLLSYPRAARGGPNMAALSVLCNGAVYGAGDPFAGSLAYVLSELLAATPSRASRDMYSISPYPKAFAYGHAACRGGAGVTGAECASCLGSAVNQMEATCGHAAGARAVLVDCRVRYEQYAFVD